jgi:hypothetical protein
MQFPIFTDGITVIGDGTEEHPLAAVGGGGGTPAAPDKSVQFNDTGVFGGSTALIFDTTPGGQKLTLDFSADLSNSEFNAIAGTTYLQAGATGLMQLSLGLAVDQQIALTNDEPTGQGIVIENSSPGGIQITDQTGGGGIQIESDVEVDIAGTNATPIVIAIGNSTDKIGFFGSGTVLQPTVAGAKLPGDTVMGSLLAALAALGLIVDTTT